MSAQSPELRISAVQMSMTDVPAENIEKASHLVRQAAEKGAQVILLPELFEGHYFPQEIDDKHFARATSVAENPAIRALSPLCKELGVALPVSFFERDGDRYYNSVVMLDADGSSLGLYRKTHIPDGAGYEEKHYFAPGDTGFRVFETRFGRIGVGICWDQWFPECARAMTLMGAEILMYPTAIGTEPEPPFRDTSAPWRRVMQGHAVANTIPVVAANRIGTEGKQRFYGTSFICDHYGEVLADMNGVEEGCILANFDREQLRDERHWMGLIRDRQPSKYSKLCES